MEVVERIVDKQIDELRLQLKEKNVELELLPAARKWLAERGFSPQFGARPMARLLQSALKKPLAERILFGDLEKGGKVILGVQEDRLDIRTE
jgi:ATP-dependent Clp protease ATP-binding subunit ClpA